VHSYARALEKTLAGALRSRQVWPVETCRANSRAENAGGGRGGRGLGGLWTVAWNSYAPSLPVIAPEAWLHRPAGPSKPRRRCREWCVLPGGGGLNVSCAKAIPE
jgi:hypothetical protein